LLEGAHPRESTPEPDHTRDTPIRRELEDVRASAARRAVRALRHPVRERRALALPHVAGALEDDPGPREALVSRAELVFGSHRASVVREAYR
jgi:hypothetical protein